MPSLYGSDMRSEANGSIKRFDNSPGQIEKSQPNLSFVDQKRHVSYARLENQRSKEQGLSSHRTINLEKVIEGDFSAN